MPGHEEVTCDAVVDAIEQIRRARQVVLVNQADRARVAAQLVRARLDDVVMLRTAEVPAGTLVLTTVGALEPGAIT